MARHDTSRSPDQLEEMRARILILEQEQVQAEQAYRQNTDRLQAQQGKYIGEKPRLIDS